MKSSHCPICQKPTVAEHRPFCSERCRLRDLGQWLSGGYAVPSLENELPEDGDLPDEYTH